MLSTRLVSFGWTATVLDGGSGKGPDTAGRQRQPGNPSHAQAAGSASPLNRKRHSWAAPVRFRFKTERTCKFCDVTKVTRHEAGVLPWIEFYRGLDKIEGEGTPKCEGMA